MQDPKHLESQSMATSPAPKKQADTISQPSPPEPVTDGSSAAPFSGHDQHSTKPTDSPTEIGQDTGDIDTDSPAAPHMAALLPRITTLEAALGRIESLVETLAATFEQRLAYDQFKEQQIDRLHSELQLHKQDLLARATRPLVTGIVRLHNDIGRVVEALAQDEAPEVPMARVVAIVQGLQGDVEILLEQNGVERTTSLEDSFDPRRQTAVRRQPTADPALAGHIAEHVRPGFDLGSTVIQKEKVAVYYVDPGTVPADSSSKPSAVDHSAVRPDLQG